MDHKFDEFDVLNHDADTEQVGIGHWVCYVGCVAGCLYYWPIAVASVALYSLVR